MESDCVSCGACVQACPRHARREKVILLGQPEHSVTTTCAYCGVGCGFKAEMKGNGRSSAWCLEDRQGNEAIRA